MTVQFVEIAGQKMVVLPVADYERLIDAAEDRSDVSAAEKAEQRRDAGEEYLSAEMVDRILRGDNPLMVWRQHRGLTQKQLGKRIGRSWDVVRKLERGEHKGTADVWVRLAEALDTSVHDIMAIN